MNMAVENLPRTLSLYEQSLKQFWQTVKRTRQLLKHSQHDIARFENLCAVIAEHDIQFTAEVSPFFISNALTYRILMNPQQSSKADEMKLTLEALGCGLTQFNSAALEINSTTSGEMYVVTSEHAPEFRLHISRSHYRNPSNG